MQAVPAVQATPQAPQLALSVFMFTQVPEQLVSPDWQLRAQLPPEQT